MIKITEKSVCEVAAEAVLEEILKHNRMSAQMILKEAMEEMLGKGWNNGWEAAFKECAPKEEEGKS